MKKSFKLFMTMLLTSSMALSFSSCSDKDVNDSNIEIPGDPYGKTTEDAQALFNILGAAAGLDSLPDNWKQSNFTVEPIIGKVLDESNPYVRTVVSTSVQEAIDYFNGYTDSDLPSDATSGSWTKEGVGAFSLNVINKDGIYATLDVNVPQMPHLTQLRFVDQSLVGDNAAPQKNPYYHIGDVVKVTQNGQAAYWVCVRDCNQANKKDRSHWISFQMINPTNYKFILANGAKEKAQVVLPTNMGHNGDTKRMLKAGVQLFMALNDPSCYANTAIYPKGLGDMGKVSYTQEMVTTIAQQWKKQNIFQKVFPQNINYQDIFRLGKLDGTLSGDSIFFYSKDGYESILGTIHLDGNYIYVNNKNALVYGSFENSWKHDNKSFNIATYVQSGKRQWNGVQDAQNPVGRTKNEALVVRYSTGSQLCGLSKNNDPDLEKPLPGNTGKGIKIEDVFHYDGKLTRDFTVGDMAQDNDGVLWTCILSPCEGNNKTIFITTDGIKTSEDGKVALNKDLPTSEDIFLIYPYMRYMIQQKGDEQLKDLLASILPVESYFQPAVYKGTDYNASSRTTFALKTMDNKHQPLMRMYYDVANRDIIKHQGFTTYQQNRNRLIYLEDAANMDLVNEYAKTDTFSINYWSKETGKRLLRTQPGNDQVAPYLYHNKGSIVNGNEVKEGYIGSNPENPTKDFYSIFMEPVVFMRVKILDQYDASDLVQIPTPYTWELEYIKQQMMVYTLVTFAGTKDDYYLNGEKYKGKLSFE